MTGKFSLSSYLERKSFLRFWLLLSLFCSLIFGWMDLSTVPVSSMVSLVSVICFWVLIACVNSAILFLMSVNRWVFTVLFIPYLLMGVVHFYYFFALGAGISPMSIEIAGATDANMWWSVMSGRLISYGLVALIAGIVVIVYRFKYVAFEWNRALVLCVSVLFVISVATLAIKRSHQFIVTKYPLIIYNSYAGYLENKKEISAERHAFDRVHVSSAEGESPIVIVVIGESLRADHLGLNGYKRNTTPRLAQEQNIISFAHTYTDATFTTVALPLLMTRSESVNDEAGYSEPSFITLFKKGGYRAVWVANQPVEQSYAYFAHEGDSAIFRNASRQMNDYRQWYDSVLRPPIKEEAAKRDSKLLLVVQPIGSHWWYPSHYGREFAKFKPECAHKDIDRTGKEELINSYDNTILATDAFLSNIISMFKDKNAVLIYMSDHGESLGENDLYLHGAESEPVSHPALFVWYSNKYAAMFPDKISALNGNVNDTIKAAELFHSVLDAAGLKTEILKPELSIFTAR